MNQRLSCCNSSWIWCHALIGAATFFFSLGVAPSIQAEDEEVQEADEEVPQPGLMQWNIIREPTLQEIFDLNLYHRKTEVELRDQFEKDLKDELQNWNNACELTNLQAEKLRLAGSGDIKRFFDGVQILRRDYLSAGVQVSVRIPPELRAAPGWRRQQWEHPFVIDLNPKIPFDKIVLNNAVNHRENLHESFTAGGANPSMMVARLWDCDLLSLFGTGSLFEKTLAQLMTPEQFVFQAEQSRLNRERKIIQEALDRFEQRMPLSPEQRVQLSRCLAEQPLYGTEIGLPVESRLLKLLSRHPQERIRPLFDDQQWPLIQPDLAELTRPRPRVKVRPFAVRKLNVPTEDPLQDNAAE